MRQARDKCVLTALVAIGAWTHSAASPLWQVHQVPDQSGVYYVGPEVTSPRLVRTVYVPYPDGLSGKNVQGMTVLAMIIQADGIPAPIQVLRSHGDAFDRLAIAAVKQSTFEPGRLGDKPVPVWIDVRVVFRANRSPATPQVLITERDLPPPDESQFEDKHRNPLSYTEPIPVHTVDADFVDPFVRHPFEQAAVVTVMVGVDGLPKDVRVRRGLGFGLDKKAEAAVWRYKFLPATKKGQPIAEQREVIVSFANF
jgi:TonB family protein